VWHARADRRRCRLAAGQPARRTWPNYASLIALGDDYAAAANYASAVLTSTLAGFYNIVTLSLGILIAGFVMLRGPFGRSTA